QPGQCLERHYPGQRRIGGLWLPGEPQRHERGPDQLQAERYVMQHDRHAAADHASADYAATNDATADNASTDHPPAAPPPPTPAPAHPPPPSHTAPDDTPTHHASARYAPRQSIRRGDDLP